MLSVWLAACLFVNVCILLVEFLFVSRRLFVQLFLLLLKLLVPSTGLPIISCMETPTGGKRRNKEGYTMTF